MRYQPVYRLILKWCLVGLALAVLAACEPSPTASQTSNNAAEAARPRMGVVVKIGGIPWFNAMEAGITEQGQKLGIDAFMIGPTSADPALQVRAIEDLIAQKVDVIGVVPNDAKVLEPVLARAQAAGIKVITHESPSQVGADWNFELASAQSEGEAHARLLAEQLNGKGDYAVFVGSLTVPLHNARANAAIAWLNEHHPEMKQLSERYGVGEDVDKSRSTALDLMAANPNLKGFLAFGSQGPIGAGRAVEERRKIGEVIVIGPFSPGQGRSLIQSGAITGGFMWNPKQSGEVFVTLADRLLKGQAINDGDEIPGLGVVHPVGNDLIVDQLLAINKDTIDELVTMGL